MINCGVRTLRYFNSAGYIVNKTRSSLDPNIVNILVVCGIGAADIEVPIFDTYQ